MSLEHASGDRRRRRFSPLLWTTCLGSVGVLTLGVTGTFSQFTAAINNPDNQVTTGGSDVLVLSESLVDANGVAQPACATASAGQSVDCPDINKNGEVGAPAEALLPGQTRTTHVVLRNESVSAAQGGLSGVLSLTVNGCTQEPAVSDPEVGDVCGTIQVELECVDADGNPAFGPTTSSLADLAAGSPYLINGSAAAVLPPVVDDLHGQVDCTFTTTWPEDAQAPNLLGVTTSQPMTWTLTQAT